MKTLEILLAQPLVAALGWALLHFIWQGTLVALLLAVVLRIVGKRSTTRYVVACAALLLMAILPLVTMVRISLTTSSSASSEPPTVFATNDSLQATTNESKSTVAATPTDSITETAWRWPANWSEALLPLLPWTILCWLLGVAFFSLRLAGGWLYTRRLKLRGVRPLEEKWQQLFQRLCHELRVTRPVQFLESTIVAVPTAIGWLRPIILLPVGMLTGLSLQQLEAIIAHELAHIRRYDYLINLLQAVIETLLFYHPAVWWVSRQIRQEREHCCDDLAVAVCGDALTYARALFEMEQLRAAAPQLALAANGGLLMNRIERLVGVQTPPNHRFAGLLACLIVLTTVVSVGAQILLPRSPQMAAVSQPETTAMSPNSAAQADAAQTPRSTQDERLAEALLQTLQNPSWEVRKATVETLARLNNNRATELLTMALRDVHPQVREQAVIGLGKRSDDRVLESLTVATTDQDWTVREQAAIALGNRKDARAIEPLLRALLDNEWQVREQAARALGAIEAKPAVEPLIYALRDEHEQVREAAAKSLGWLEDQRALEPLTQALQDASEQVRKKAAEALGLLKPNGNEPSTIRKSRREDLPVREEIKQRYSLSAAARVEVSYILGSVEIEATDSTEAEVEIVRSANAQADLDRFDRIIIEPNPTRLVLRGEDSKSNGIEIRHHVRLRLPRSSQLSLREINGRVSINGLEGAIRLNEVNGGALIPHLIGELEMSGVNGGIKLGIARLVPNGIRIRDITSGIDLRIADGVNAELQIGELDDAPLIETSRVSLNQTGEKVFQGRIGAGGPVIRIIDVNGQVRIRNA